MPLVARCEYSISVPIVGEGGITSPLQVGQWAPQPAPDPVARTTAPHKMTRMFQARVNQARRERNRGAGGWVIGGLPFQAVVR